jgi:hypothetical protein
MKEPRLGIDFGRVINDASAHPSGDDTAFLSGDYEDAMGAPAMAGAYDMIASLVTLFDGRVWIVSKCGERIQERTLQWLDYNEFWTKTGVSPDNVRFCRQRPEKAIHCKRLGITHFIDDRRDVLGHLRGLVDHLYLFGHQKAEAPDWVTHTLTWGDVILAVNQETPAEPRSRATRRSR